MEGDLRNTFTYHRRYSLGVDMSRATTQDLFCAVSLAVRNFCIDGMPKATEQTREQAAKSVFYLSMEFRMGQSLENNLRNLKSVVADVSSGKHGSRVLKTKRTGRSVSLVKPGAGSDLFDAVATAMFGDIHTRGLRDGPIETVSVPGKTGFRILIAEDNQVNQIHPENVLVQMGHTVKVVENGPVAVDAFMYGKLDLILMDVQMPLMDGIEATRRIRNHETSNSRLPIIALTAHALASDQKRCLNAGMDDYVTKPIVHFSLRCGITKHIGKNKMLTTRHLRSNVQRVRRRPFRLKSVAGRQLKSQQ